MEDVKVKLEVISELALTEVNIPTPHVYYKNDIKKELSHFEVDSQVEPEESNRLDQSKSDCIIKKPEEIYIKPEPFFIDQFHIEKEIDEGTTTTDNTIENFSQNQHYSCDLPNQTYASTAGGSQQHLNTPPKSKLFECTICEYKCLNNQLLDIKQHIKEHTVKISFTCSVCDYNCAYRSHFERHMKIHTGEKPHKCIVCDYTSAHKANLQQHMKSHSTEKPFMCSLCDYRSAHKHHIKLHKKIHTEETHFECSVCGHTSKHKRSLNLHMKTHTGEKPFTCEQCDYWCLQKVHLTQHRIIHTGQKPFQCNDCDYKCIVKSRLERHNKKVHAGIKSDSMLNM